MSHFYLFSRRQPGKASCGLVGAEAETRGEGAGRKARRMKPRATPSDATSGCSYVGVAAANWLPSRAQSVLERGFTVVQAGFAAGDLAEMADAKHSRRSSVNLDVLPGRREVDYSELSGRTLVCDEIFLRRIRKLRSPSPCRGFLGLCVRHACERSYLAPFWKANRRLKVLKPLL